MAKRGRPPHRDILTPREWEVLACIREGLSNEEIAERLGISLDGVKYHVTEILSKLGLENRHDAARWRPEEKPAWLLLAPLLLARRLGIRWLSPALVGALAVAVTAGIGLLVWALVATNGGSGTTSTGVPTGQRLAYIFKPGQTPPRGAPHLSGDLWVADEGRPARQLTSDGQASSPRWWNEQQLAFLRDGQLWLAPDAPEGQLRQLAHGPVESFTWTPNGQDIIFSFSGAPVVAQRKFEIWSAPTDPYRQPSKVSDASSSEFALSPDGHTVAFWREELCEKEANPPITDTCLTLWTTDLYGEETKRVVGASELLAALRPYVPSNLGVASTGGLQWSMDGRWLSFFACGSSASLCQDTGYLFIVSSDASAVRYVTTTVRPMEWAPDSSRIVVVKEGGRAYDRYPRPLVVIDLAEQAEPKEISPAGVEDNEPQWSPDGRWLLFQSRPAVRSNSPRCPACPPDVPERGIWTMRPNGSERRQLTSAEDFDPRWSADGQWILFTRITDGQQAQLWIMRSDGTEPRQVGEIPSRDSLDPSSTYDWLTLVPR